MNVALYGNPNPRWSCFMHEVKECLKSRCQRNCENWDRKQIQCLHISRISETHAADSVRLCPDWFDCADISCSLFSLSTQLLSPGFFFNVLWEKVFLSVVFFLECWDDCHFNKKVLMMLFLYIGCGCFKCLFWYDTQFCFFFLSCRKLFLTFSPSVTEARQENVTWSVCFSED